MPKRRLFAMVLIALALGPVALGQPSAPAHGYALPTDRSPAADALPRADPPDRPGWNRNLDLPPVENYEAEVLRYVRTGVTPTLVVQFAVVSQGEPVQVMVIHARGEAEHPDTSRAFGHVSWATFLRLKGQALPPMTVPPDEPPPPAAGEIVVRADAADCSLGYAGPGLTVRRQLSCSDDGPLQDVSRALIDTAEAAAPAR
jgi:hypothetical protein